MARNGPNRIYWPKKVFFYPKKQFLGQDMFFTQKRVAEIGGNPTPSLRGKTLHYRI